MLTQPSRLTFWRLILATTFPLVGLSLWDAFSLAEKLGIAPLTSKTWLAILGALALIGLASLILFLLTFGAQQGKVLAALEIVEKTAQSLPLWLGWPVFLAALAAYPLIMFHPYYGDLLVRQSWLRLFLFWIFAIVATQALKLAWPRLSWPGAFLVALLLQATVQRVALYLPDITAYPFAMGWSETSRYYYPALFVSRKIFGQAFAWPILHPSLHLVLTPPYWIDAPLWFHRFWQVFVRFLLVGLIAPALLWRLKIENKSSIGRWLAGIWIFLYLFTLPLYLHLAVPVFIMLWGFSAHNERRTWFWLMVASVWAGLSRLNWYPMPGILAAVLYFLEIPIQPPDAKSSWKSVGVYLLKPVLWLVVGTAVAFAVMRSYIYFSGLTNPGDFYTSLTSSLLWVRLWPNASSSLGVLPGIILFSAPLWAVGVKSLKTLGSWLRVGFILAALLVLFVGGIFVSMKIGGGADIHNMDAYAVLLLIVFAYLFFARQTPENGQPVSQVTLHWSVTWLLVLIPAWFAAQGAAGFWQYDSAKSQATLTAIQQRVDSVNAGGGEILFITQRHLISMHMLSGVKLIPEYEREELMEMAMAQNEAYLKVFRDDLEKHRFAAIIVDPLRFNFVGQDDAMGAENNAWTRYVVKKILCNYKQAAIFPADRIAIYVPQVGTQTCP